MGIHVYTKSLQSLHAYGSVKPQQISIVCPTDDNTRFISSFAYVSCTFLVRQILFLRSSTAGYTQEKFRAFSKLWKGHHQTNTSAYNTVVIRICMNFYSYTFAGIMRAHCKKYIQRRFFLQLPLL